MMKINTLAAIPVLLLCLFVYSPDLIGSESRDTTTVKGSAGSVISVESIAEFNEPWAMTFLSEDTIFHGQRFQKGDVVALYYPSANRDEDVFEEPFRFDIGRVPNRHIAFGVGEHFCAGAHVARLEMEMAFKFLLPRLEEIELTGEPARLHSNLIGGIKHLPVRYKLSPA